MKQLPRICGVVCLVLAAILISTAVFGHILRASADENAYRRALLQQKLISSHRSAAEKTAPAAIKKAATAVKSASGSLEEAKKAAENARRLLSAYAAGESGEELLSAIYAAEEMLEGLDSAEAARAALAGSAQAHTLSLVRGEYGSAHKAVAAARAKLREALESINSVYAASGLGYALSAPAPLPDREITSPDHAEPAFLELEQAANELYSAALTAQEEAQSALTRALDVSRADYMPLSSRLALIIGARPIGFAFTGALFLLAGLTMLLWFEPFRRAWRTLPLFSTLMALAVMTVIQIYALGFSFDSYGAWGNSWLKNMLNVLRSNSSNGMIALGMTFVIITGGIDLSVGSNLAGVATVVMVILDVSANGKITALGLSGWPNYILAIAAGLLLGAALGALTGLGIAKGRIPPFIFTLGVMEITRSVAQYFTRSFKTDVPKAFQVIANREIIGGQMLLPIIYWLALAAVMYVISRHTAFGKHIYAVGSNERTSRLSGINVDGVKIRVYMLMGIIVAIAAITQVARLRGVDVASAGSGYEMNAIAAVVVGGTSMSGGRGSVMGTVLGVLIIGIMNNLLVLLGIDAFLANAFTGAIIIFSVLIQRKDK